MDDNRGATTDEEVKEERRGRGCGCWIALILVLVAGPLLTAPLVGMIVFRQETPLPGEEFMADFALRTLAVPGEYADMRMPQRETISVEAGREAFAVQCAFCHGQGGRGDAPLGQTMYPKAADLTRSRTQSKSDGQLFWLIAHGVNLTGMPGFGQQFGTEEAKGFLTDDQIWSLVAYIRTLDDQ